MQPQDNKYTYADAGFNGFLLRSRKSNPMANNVSDSISTGTGSPISFDRIQAQGALGGKLTLGRLVLDGIAGRIVTQDQTGTDTGWIGDLNA